MLSHMWKVGSVLAALALSACVGSEVTQTGGMYPVKPEGCPIKIFPSTTPDYKWEDIASVKAHCNHREGRSACIEELKKRTCEVGGDTLYAFKDGIEGGDTVVIATVALRTDGSALSGVAAPSPPPATTALPTTGPCDPPCSPGYKCSSEGQCLALCNPPCGEGMRCNQQRMCESAARAPSAP